ncbi:MAG: hypothetical protein JWM89_4056 [Acidimicrobiales bacterium]|nr:hypothetical protein [Acidimicrobiales bacterium]
MDWARTEVDLARKELDLPLAGLVDLLPSALEATGAFTVDMRRLSAKFDREDALLLPRLSGGFRIVVDPDVSPSDRAHAHLYPDDQSFVAATHAWRIAHEVGHSRYYHASSGDRVVSYVDREEVVADLFAAHLLLPEWAIASDDPGIASFPVLALLAAPDLSARLMGLVVAS